MPNFELQGKQADSRAGDVVLPYSAPSKHHGQRTHRYLVAVLEQPHGKLAVSAPKHRSHFKIQVAVFQAIMHDFSDAWLLFYPPPMS